MTEFEVPQQHVCPHCGGTELTVEAYADWDVVKQCWDFEITAGSNDWCSDCQTNVLGTFIPVDDVKTLALIAIYQEENNTPQPNIRRKTIHRDPVTPEYICVNTLTFKES